MASPRSEPGVGNGFPGQPTARPQHAEASAPHPPDHQHAARRHPGDLYLLVRHLLTEAGLYDPRLRTSDLRLMLSGRSVVIGWSAAGPQARPGIRHAVRRALLELLAAAAGLDARYEPPAGRRTGTITVTYPDYKPRNAEPHPASASAARSARSPFD